MLVVLQMLMRVVLRIELWIIVLMRVGLLFAGIVPGDKVCLQ